MSLQINMLKNYRSAFPTDTLREISNRTGIQLTRVFRLLNGSPMKLSEYETFHHLLENQGTMKESVSAIKLLKVHGHKLSSIEMNKICEYIHRKIQINGLISIQPQYSTQNQELA